MLDNTDMGHDPQTLRIILDWGHCQRMLDHIQWGCEHDDLAPRVKALVDYLTASVGIPTSEPLSDRLSLPARKARKLEKKDPNPKKRKARTKRAT